MVALAQHVRVIAFARRAAQRSGAPAMEYGGERCVADIAEGGMEILHALMLGTRNGAKIRGVQAAFTDVREALQAPDLSLPDT